MATRRRFSHSTEAAPRSWGIARRVALPPPANDNRLPAHLRLVQYGLLAAFVGALAWVIAGAL